MSAEMKLLFTIVSGLIMFSWTASIITCVRQATKGCAFYMDESGIHTTVSASIVLAFIVVVPIQTIPYEAIRSIGEKDGVLTLQLDKSKVQTVSFLRAFVRSEYHLCHGFTTAKTEEVKSILERFVKA